MPDPSTGSTSSSSADLGGFGPNEWLVDELYQQYLADKSSVDKSWWDFFADYTPDPGGVSSGGGPSRGNGAGTAPSAFSAAASTGSGSQDKVAKEPVKPVAQRAESKAAPAKAEPAKTAAAKAASAKTAAAKTAAAKTERRRGRVRRHSG